MRSQGRTMSAFLLAGLIAMAGIGSFPARATGSGPLNGTIWAANRGTHTIRGFDADTGDVLHTVNMAPNSEPGDLAYAKGKLYVAEERGSDPAVAIVDAQSGNFLGRIPVPVGSRPHHVHASSGGNLVAVGLYGTDMVAVIDTHTDTLLGSWDSNPGTSNARIHAGVFSNDESMLYLASDTTGEVVAIDPRTGFFFWRLAVPAAHELAVTHDQRTLYVTRRTQNQLAVVHLEPDATIAPTSYQDVLALGLPDTLRLSANEKLLTVGLRTMPAQLAVVHVDTWPYVVELVRLSVNAPSEALTIGGHQWTAPSGRYTLATWEGGASPGIAIIDHNDGNSVVRIDYPGRPHGVVHTP
jgi:PQQ-like domain